MIITSLLRDIINLGDDNMTDLINANKLKNIILGIAALAVYFILPDLKALPFELLNIDVSSLSTGFKIIYSMFYELAMMAIIIALFFKTLKQNWIDLKKNHNTYFKTYFKYWLIALAIMMFSNAIINLLFEQDLPANEAAVRDLFNTNPLYTYFSAVLFAPIVEELVFRQGFRNILGNNIIFILMSGLVFGGLHVVSSANTWVDYLYLIPYCTPGLIFAYILSKTENVLITISLHFMHNGLLMSLQFLLLLLS